jgi:2,4-dienoyl-CoA reductase-like NADH-dependent reductase (Old Yellow Enzyme family)
MRERGEFEQLLAPGRIGSLEIRNRILMSPMGSNLAQEDGHVGERIKRYYEERARGGVGLIIVGVGAISFPAGACNPNQIAISDDAFLPGLSDLTRRVHTRGAKIAIQLQHAGKVAVRDIVDGRPMWVPSVLPYKGGDLTNDLTPDELQRFVANLTQPGARMAYHEMTQEDIAHLVAAFADAAERARRAGFDGIELHAGHGYILSSFLSPATNRREDEYGGPLENRARFLVETIRAAKARAGADFPVWCRIDSKEFRTAGGITEEDGRRTAELAEAAGADAIHVSAYADSTSGVAFTDAPLVHQPCGYVALAAAIKRRVGIPVIAVGRIEPAEGNALIAEGSADFIAMARKLLADPELPNKLRDGRPEDVRPCIYCYTCVGNIFLNAATCCAVNPATGREDEFPLAEAKAKKRVLVVGGGPAGMEAARVAALRGHDVTLCEARDRLGGTLFFAALCYEVNGKLIEWLETQVKKLPVELRLGTKVTPALVKELAPDVVLVAVGARHAAPPIPGVDRPDVFSGDDLRRLLTGGDPGAAARKLTRRQRAVLRTGSLLGLSGRLALVRAVTRHWMPLGRRIAIVGGGLVGVELAEFLSQRGRQVAVLEESAAFAAEMAPPRRWRALHQLRERGVELWSQVRVEAIGDEGVRFADAEGARHSLAVDSVILATGAREDRALADAISNLGAEVHSIGDCDGLGYIAGAIQDAARVAREI